MRVLVKVCRSPWLSCPTLSACKYRAVQYCQKCEHIFDNLCTCSLKLGARILYINCAGYMRKVVEKMLVRVTLARSLHPVALKALSVFSCHCSCSGVHAQGLLYQNQHYSKFTSVSHSVQLYIIVWKCWTRTSWPRRAGWLRYRTLSRRRVRLSSNYFYYR